MYVSYIKEQQILFCAIEVRFVLTELKTVIGIHLFSNGIKIYQQSIHHLLYINYYQKPNNGRKTLYQNSLGQ